MIDPQTLMIQPSFNEAGCVKQRYVRLPFSENLIGQGISSKQYVLDLTLMVQSKKIDFIQGLKINAYPRKDIGHAVSSDSETWDCCIDFGNGFKEFVSMEKGVGSINAFPIFVNNPPQVTITFFGRDGADLSTIYADFYFTNYLLRPESRNLISKETPMPRFVGAMVYKTSDEVIPNATYSPIALGAVSYDTDSIFDAASSSFIIPENGIYVVGAQLAFENNNNGFRGVAIRYNSSPLFPGAPVGVIQNIPFEYVYISALSPPIFAGAGSVFSLTGFQDSGGPLNVLEDGGHTFFYINKVG